MAEHAAVCATGLSRIVLLLACPKLGFSELLFADNFNCIKPLPRLTGLVVSSKEPETTVRQDSLIHALNLEALDV